MWVHQTQTSRLPKRSQRREMIPRLQAMSRCLITDAGERALSKERHRRSSTRSMSLYPCSPISFLAFAFFDELLQLQTPDSEITHRLHYGASQGWRLLVVHAFSVSVRN